MGGGGGGRGGNSERGIKGVVVVGGNSERGNEPRVKEEKEKEEV
jgi:hypothetical protein